MEHARMVGYANTSTIADEAEKMAQEAEKAGRRIPFLSAMSMLGAADGETHSYLEILLQRGQTG